ncbi:Uma2 family endonuclease [bacterium]|nr:Uma2 family endonuclease [bacterium]
MSQLVNKHFTYDEYLELEKNQDIRYDFHKGEVVARTGTTKKHNRIKNNLFLIIDQAIEGSGCEMYDENIKTEIKPGIPMCTRSGCYVQS